MTGADLVPFQPPVETLTTLELAPEAWKLASRVADTEFVPKALRGKPEAVLACILAGHEAGLSPMTSLRSIHVIEGRPSMSAELMRAIVQRAGHDIWVEETTTTRAIVAGQRSGSERVLKITWTEDDARRAQLLGKDVWKKYPAAMLVARASAQLARMLFPDVLAGISHAYEELVDGSADEIGEMGPPEARDGSTPAPATSRTRARRAAVAAHTASDPAESEASPANHGDTPALPGEEDIIDAEIVETPAPGAPSYASERRDMEAPPLPTAADEVDDDPPLPTEGPRLSGAQVIAIRFAEHGIGDRDGKLRWVTELIGRPLGTTNDLTPEETRAVLEFLDGLAEGQQLERLPALEAPAPDPAPPAKPPTRATAVTPPEEWTGDRWRDFLKRRSLKVAPVLKEAQRLGAERDPVVLCGTLDDLAGSGLCADLVAWCEEQ